MLQRTSPKAKRLASEEYDYSRQYMREISRFSLLTADQEIELASKIASGDEAAFRQFVEANLRLVTDIARKHQRFAGQQLSLDDLIQEGNLGLMRAIKKFDHRKGCKFSTYGCYWIIQAIMRAIADHGRPIRLPVHMVEWLSKAGKHWAIMAQRLGRPPTISELASEMKIGENKTREIVAQFQETISLDWPINEGEDTTLGDLLVDRASPSPFDHAARQELRRIIEEAMVLTLNQREQKVLRLRSGWDNGQPQTLDEVGAYFKLTRERVRQIEKMALKKLRQIDSLREMAIEPNHNRPRRRPKNRLQLK